MCLFPTSVMSWRWRMSGTDSDLYRWTALVAIILVGFSLLFSYLEGWSLFDSFYYVLCTSTTSGFGDVVVSEENRPIATVFIMVSSTVVLALAANVGQWILDSVYRRRAVREFMRGFEEAKVRLRTLGKDTSDLEAELDRIMHEGLEDMGSTDAESLDLDIQPRRGA